MQEILRDGTEQIIYLKIYKSDAFSVIDGGTPSSTVSSQEYIGDSDGDVIEGVTATLSEYKLSNVTLSSPVITWDTALRMWGVAIPSANLTQYGNCVLTLQKTDVIYPATVEFKTVSVVDSASYLKSEIDLLPTASEIVSAYDSEVVDGIYTRIQVERIITAVLIGIRIKADGYNTYTGMDGTTPRLVTSLAPDSRSIISRDGDIS